MSATVDDETILEVLRSNDAPRMTTTEVAGQLPVTRGTTRTRLQRLVDDDLIERKTEGNNVVWWLPERTDELEAWEAEAGATEDAASDAEAEAAAADEVAETEAAAMDEGTEADTEAEPSDEEPAEGETAAPDEDTEAVDEPEATEGEDVETDETGTDETETDETTVEVEATEQAKAETDDGATAVEVEAVDDGGIDEVNVTTPDEETETRTGAERSELSEDEEGLQALALLAAAIVVFLLFRKLLSGSEETE